jgi:hypothetical protein
VALGAPTSALFPSNLPLASHLLLIFQPQGYWRVLMNKNEGFDITETSFRIVYLWHGERHVVLETYTDRKAAHWQVIQLRERGINAWLEEIR